MVSTSLTPALPPGQGPAIKFKESETKAAADTSPEPSTQVCSGRGGYSGRVKQGQAGAEGGSEGRWTWSGGQKEQRHRRWGAKGTGESLVGSLQGTHHPALKWDRCSQEVATVLQALEMSHGQERVCFVSPSVEVSLATEFSPLPWLHCHRPPHLPAIWTLQPRIIPGKGKCIAKLSLQDRRSLPHLPP